MSRLSGKVAIVTGGASGIGEATVKLFVEEGAKVVIADLNEEAGNTLADSLGDAAVFQPTDVTDEAQVKAMVDRAVSEFGRLDILHSNAGSFGARGSILDIEVDKFDFTFALLVRSVFLGVKHAGRVMKEQGGGSIINTASISGFTAGYGPHIYQGAKAAVLQLTRSMALEMAEYNVRLNCVSPGGVYTPLIGDALGTDDEGRKQLADGMGATLPLNRVAVPLDIAKAVLFLASDESGYITSQNITVDGGEATGKKWTHQGLN